MKEEPKLTAEWLMKRGYTFSAAARRLGVSTVQVSQVVHGKRSSRSLEAKLLALPPRKFVCREKISPTRSLNAMKAKQLNFLFVLMARSALSIYNHSIAARIKGLTSDDLHDLDTHCGAIENLARQLRERITH